jgi:hypothetical protein
MKKSLVASFSIIMLCIILAVPIFLQASFPESPILPTKTPQTTQQITSQNSPQTTPQQTSQTTPKTAPQDTPQPTQQTSPQTTQNAKKPSNRTLQEAIGNATNYLEGTNEPYALLLLNVVYRRFNITLFADSLQRYNQAMAQSTQENLPILRVFRRIADYNNPIQNSDLQAITSETDKLTVPALYCNRYGLPSNYAVTLEQAINSQDYIVTHALLATIWIHENGYALSVPTGFYDSLYHANAALIGTDSAVTDVELEAATFLYIAGQVSIVNPDFIQSVIAAQNIDGGWLESSGNAGSSNWHSSVLGLLLLLQVENPFASYPSMLAQVS